MKWSLTQFLCLLLFKWINISEGLEDDATQNEIQVGPGSKGSSQSCCECDYSDLLTRFIEAIGNDVLSKKFEFQGPPGPEGLIGPEGLQGRPGREGDAGPIGPAGARGQRGERGRVGRKGQKGEPAETIVQRQLPGQRVIQVAGQKGDHGKRGERGEKGVPGLTVVGEKGEPGTAGEFTWELKESIKGAKGERGVPGRPLNCRSCYNVRKKMLGKEQENQEEKIYVPVEGRPGKNIVGSPGPKGEPGEAGRVTKNHVVVLSYEDELSKVFDEYALGTMAYVRATQTLFIQTDQGWQEITLSERFIDPYAHRRRHQKRGTKI